MIPRTKDDLDAQAAEAARQLAELDGIVAEHGRAALERRADPARWSAAGHIAHLCLVNGRYLDAIEERTRRARAAGGPTGDGPYRHPLFGSWFARSMEPPPKRRYKTMKAMVPDPEVDTDDVVGRFGVLQRRLIAALEAAHGLDLGRIRFGSPFARIVRLSLGTGFELLLAHNRRHIWLIREALDQRGGGRAPRSSSAT